MEGAGEEPKRRASYPCAICGDEAFGRNFGAITCESCKSFYRRHVGRHSFECPSLNNCTINKVTRKYCPACRMSKCFKVGMKRPVDDARCAAPAEPNEFASPQSTLSAQSAQSVESPLLAAHNGTTSDVMPYVSRSRPDSTEMKVGNGISHLNIRESPVFTSEGDKSRSKAPLDTKLAKLNPFSEQYDEILRILSTTARTLEAEWQLVKQIPASFPDAATPVMPQEIAMLYEAIPRRYVQVTKGIPDFRSLDKQVQLIIMRRSLLSQAILFGCFFSTLDAEAGVTRDANGKVLYVVHESALKVFQAYGLDACDCFARSSRISIAIRSEFPNDWALLVLVMSMINLFSTPIAGEGGRDQDDTVLRTRQSMLDERRNRFLTFLRTYLDRHYGDASACKLDFCMRMLNVDVPKAYDSYVRNLGPLFSVAQKVTEASAAGKSDDANALPMELIARDVVKTFAPLLLEVMAQVASDTEQAAR